MIETGWGEIILHPYRQALGPTQPPVQWVPGPLPGGRVAGVWRWPPTLSPLAPRLKKVFIYTSTPTMGFYAYCRVNSSPPYPPINFITRLWKKYYILEFLTVFPIFCRLDDCLFRLVVWVGTVPSRICRPFDWMGTCLSLIVTTANNARHIGTEILLTELLARCVTSTFAADC